MREASGLKNFWSDPHNPVTGLTAASDISPFIASGEVWKNKEEKWDTQREEKLEDERQRDQLWKRRTDTHSTKHSNLEALYGL